MAETLFDPWAALAGGILIGLACTLLMLTLGRIMGATGVLSGLLIPASTADFTWRAAVVAGMVSAPLLAWLLSGAMPVITIPTSTSAIVVGGLIVGVGVTLGSGCTSGHGVCGFARLSVRSIVFIAISLLASVGTVYIIRHGV